MSDVVLQYPVNSLVSFHYFRKVNVAEVAGWGLRLIGDSGAYSAKSVGAVIDVDEFAEWIRTWRGSLLWAASLDVIGNPTASYANYRRLRHHHNLQVIPTIHYGTDPSEMDRYADDGVDFIGMGGMATRGISKASCLRWAVGMMRYAKARHPGMRFHGWAGTRLSLTMNLPFYSVDSTSFASAYRYGGYNLFNPATGKWTSVQANGRDLHAHRDLFERHYPGADLAELASVHSGNLPTVIRLSARSFQLFEQYLQGRFHVSAPTYGIADDLRGPHIHLADAATSNLMQLRQPVTA